MLTSSEDFSHDEASGENLTHEKSDDELSTDMDHVPIQLSVLCPLCDRQLCNHKDSITDVKTKGIKTLTAKSRSYNDSKWKRWENASVLTCHEACRKKYIKTPISKISTSDNVSTTSRKTGHRLRDSSSSNRALSSAPSTSNTESDAFDFKRLCIYCGRFCDFDRHRRLVRHVQDPGLKHRLVDMAKHMYNPLGSEILHRVNLTDCLVKVEACYHIKCGLSFIVQAKSDLSSRLTSVQAPFNAVCKYIETSGKCEFTSKELQDQCQEYPIPNHILYRKLTAKYGTDIFIHHVRRNSAIVYYKYFDSGDLFKKFYSEKSLEGPEKLAIFKVAAELLRKDIENREYKKTNYPSTTEFFNDVENDVPESLMTFLGLLLGNDDSGDSGRYRMKRSCLAHSIIQSVRGSKFVSKLQLGIGTYIYRKTVSKQIVDLLNKIGICSSYDNLVQFENLAATQAPIVTNKKAVHVQHVFSNTDHYVRTVDGLEALHCLGGIAVYTPESDVTREGPTMSVAEHNTATSVAVANKVSIEAIPYLHGNAKDSKAVEYIDTNTLNLSSPQPLPSPYCVYLWAKSLEIPNIPSWSGFMEVASNNEIPLTSRAVCLPFIKESPSKSTTLNTALHSAQAEANKLNQKTCFVTFDQPLYRQARAIVAQSQENGQLNNVVVRLGGFHLLMSYLGAVGYIMGGSGLDSLWSVAYAPASVKQMLDGHAYSRAMRAHILTFTAIGVLISESMENDNTENYYTLVSSFMDKWQDENLETPTIDELRSNTAVAEMTEEFMAQINILKNNGPTAQLWLQYFQLIVIALQFVEAERLGNWKLHLQTVKEMLPVFHAAGHVSHAKNAQLYLQDMLKLENELANDVGYKLFSKEGYFTVRRCEKTWTGAWSDMTIEQTFNRYFPTDFKHGKGISPGVLARYLTAMPAVFGIMKSVEDYFDTTEKSSEPYNDLDTTRLKRDDADLAKFLFWLRKNAPLDRRPNLVSMSTGIIGGSNIDCHLAAERGRELMRAMVGQNPMNCPSSMANRVKTLESTKSGVHLGGTSRVTVNLTQLFHRISVALAGNEEKRKEAFDYELSPFPLALFDEKGFMRKTNKTEFYEILKPYRFPKSFKSLSKFMAHFDFVIDGRFLLHRVTWSNKSTYKDIFEKYRAYIMDRFGGNACVIFDGYDNGCTGIESYERFRRREKNLSADFEISPDASTTLSQQIFLSNTGNKRKFVQLLSEYLKKSGIRVSVVKGDVDALIVRTALSMDTSVAKNPVAIVGNNVELLVLLIGLTNERHRIYYYEMVPRAKMTEIYLSSDHNDLRQFILFAHAFVGCDLTCALQSKDKKTIIKLLNENANLRERCKVFYDPHSKTEKITSVAQEFISHLYGFGNEQTTIGAVRYRKYEDATDFDTITRLSSLPPTAGAIKEHAKRVYLRVQTWLGNRLNPELWGWSRSENVFLPIMNEQSPAPEYLLNMVFCSCTTSCANSYCGCRKLGMPCSSLCKNCDGIGCENSRPTESDEIFAEVDGNGNHEADDEIEVDSDYFADRRWRTAVVK